MIVLYLVHYRALDFFSLGISVHVNVHCKAKKMCFVEMIDMIF